MKKTFKPMVALFVIFTCMLLAKTPVSAQTTHTVVRGDTLSGIAKQYYGDASKWREIFETNKDTIANPNLLQIGWVLDLSGKEEKQEVRIETPPVVSRSVTPKEVLHDVRATAYDLSVASCGKLPSHPAYGITKSGKSIAGMTREQATCVAVDPKVIPLGSLLYISFENPDYIQYNDIYQALDVGGGVKGRSVDIFLGDFNSTKENFEVRQFGVTKAKVTILRNGW